MSAERPQLDELPTAAVVAALLDAEARVVPALRDRAAAVAAAADLVADRWAAGGRLLFVGAGTSGRIAAAEAAELPGTFALPRDRVLAVVAGGVAATDAAEDDLQLAARDVAALRPSPADVCIAVAASGSTPYTIAIAQAAGSAGTAVVAVTTTAGSALEAICDVAVVLEVGPEVLRGSSRLTAGTAQKIALNAITTAAMARVGKVHGDHMIDVEPANAKLRERVAGIVADISGADHGAARAALSACSDDARAAVLHLVRGVPPERARVLAAAYPRLRDALSAELPAADVSDR